VTRYSTVKLLLLLATVAAIPATLAEGWKALEDDDLHDPSNPAVSILQDPEEALSVLAPDSAGNKVNWVEAIRRGQIKPRASLYGDKPGKQHDSDVVMKNTLDLPFVLFPHRAHNEWMSCEMCHETLFQSVRDGNAISMVKILEGEFCGVCHGAVSFPLTECNRCHSVLRDGAPASSSGALVPKE
jgi:c(7)-type cytochrome triheme protein